jgi:ribose 5-phosphate isomerase A
MTALTRARSSSSCSTSTTTPKTNNVLIRTTATRRGRTERRRLRARTTSYDRNDDETPRTTFDSALLAVARKAAEMIKPDMTIAISTGSIASKLLDVLLVEDKGTKTTQYRGCKYVPSSLLAAKELALRGLSPLVDVDDLQAIDIVFIQPSETAVYYNEITETKNIVAVLDRQQTPIQPSIIQTKKVLRKSLKTIVLTEHFRNFIGGSVPVELGIENWQEIAEELDDCFLGDAEVWRRGNSGQEQSHPMGGANPYISPDGLSTIVDLKFEDALKGGRYSKGFVLAGEDCSPFQIQAEIESCGGEDVLAHGLFLTADCALSPWGDLGLDVLVLQKGDDLPFQ